MPDSPKAPRTKTVRALVALSGNRCAFPGCSRRYFDPVNDVILGKIAHIRAQGRSGPRANSTLTTEQTHALANLIVLCADHHTLVDAKPDDYPVETLLAWKEAAESGPAEEEEAVFLRAMARIGEEQKQILAEGIEAIRSSIVAQSETAVLVARPLIDLSGTGGGRTLASVRPEWTPSHTNGKLVAFEFRYIGSRIVASDAGARWRGGRFDRGRATVVGEFDFSREPNPTPEWPDLPPDEIGLEVRYEHAGEAWITRFRRPWEIGGPPGKPLVDVKERRVVPESGPESKLRAG